MDVIGYRGVRGIGGTPVLRQPGDGLPVHWRAIGRDAILGQMAVMPDQPRLVECTLLDRPAVSDITITRT